VFFQKHFKGVESKRCVEALNALCLNRHAVKSCLGKHRREEEDSSSSPTKKECIQSVRSMTKGKIFSKEIILNLFFFLLEQLDEVAQAINQRRIYLNSATRSSLRTCPI